MANETEKISEYVNNQKPDPGFLVAKGRFVSSYEATYDVLFKKRDNYLRQGAAGDSAEVVDLTRQMQDLDDQIDDDRKSMERDHVKNLASAIFMAMSRCGYANIRAVGRNANYNAVKSIAIAGGYCKTKGIDVCFEVSFDEGNLGELRNQHHVKSVTAILYKLKGYKEWKGDEAV